MNCNWCEKETTLYAIPSPNEFSTGETNWWIVCAMHRYMHHRDPMYQPLEVFETTDWKLKHNNSR